MITLFPEYSCNYMRNTDTRWTWCCHHPIKPDSSGNDLAPSATYSCFTSNLQKTLSLEFHILVSYSSRICTWEIFQNSAALSFQRLVDPFWHNIAKTCLYVIHDWTWSQHLGRKPILSGLCSCAWFTVSSGDLWTSPVVRTEQNLELCTKPEHSTLSSCASQFVGLFKLHVVGRFVDTYPRGIAHKLHSFLKGRQANRR